MIHELEEVFTKGKNTYKQVMNNDAGYIYQINDDQNFEVFKRIVKPKQIFDENGFIGHSEDFMVVYPTESQWGISAWTFLFFDSAYEKLMGLKQHKDKLFKI